MSERDLQDRRKNLLHSLKGLPEHALNHEKAIRALEDWAVLAQAGERPPDAGYDEAAALFRRVTGRDLASVQSTETFVVEEEAESPAQEVSLIRGMRLQLTASAKLHSIIVLPEKLSERQRMLSIIGVGRDRDLATDVAKTMTSTWLKSMKTESSDASIITNCSRHCGVVCSSVSERRLSFSCDQYLCRTGR